MRRRWRLAAPFCAGLGLMTAMATTSCSSGSEAQSLTTVTIGPQSYSQKAPATTTTTIALEDARPGDVVHEEQEYIVQPNDGLSAIAARYELTAEEVAAFNGWADGVNHRIDPGQTIRIPPGAVYVDETTLTTTTTTTEPLAGEDEVTTESTNGESDDVPATTDAGQESGNGEDDCIAGTYEVQATDATRLAVAERFDVTVQALDAINADTPGYSGFYPGLEILIPQSSDC